MKSWLLIKTTTFRIRDLSLLDATLLLAAVITLLGSCGRLKKDEVLSDPTLVMDQHPVSKQGWSLSKDAMGNTDSVTDSGSGLVMRDSVKRVTSQGNFELIPQSAFISRNLKALDNSVGGSLRLEFKLNRQNESGSFIFINFTGGQGLPAQLRLGDKSMTARCGYIGQQDGISSVAKAVDTPAGILHVLKMSRSDADLTISVDGQIVFSKIPCAASTTVVSPSRDSGKLEISLQSLPPANGNPSQSGELLIKRVSVFAKALDLEAKK